MKRLLKVSQITGLSVSGLLVLVFLVPLILPGKVTYKIKNRANARMEVALTFFQMCRRSLFNHLPSAMVTLYDFSLKGPARLLARIGRR